MAPSALRDPLEALARNVANPSNFFELPPAQVVEVGAQVDL